MVDHVGELSAGLLLGDERQGLGELRMVSRGKARLERQHEARKTSEIGIHPRLPAA
ncbi:hypothetical protein [Streptomyces sp. 8N616]|uniref:hypothetical protein n=1 Tax=Streptomyces sp. 8N616 TaxID=3457414 RepID=UPI003FD15C9F